jgi:hypothetical protein
MTRKQCSQQVAQLCSQFFAQHPNSCGRRDWQGAARFVNQSLNQERTWKPQGLARACAMVQMQDAREASPQMVTPERRRAFQLIAVQRGAGVRWEQIAASLTAEGLYWRPVGREPVPYTSKTASDMYRHHQKLWPIKPRRDSKVQMKFGGVLPVPVKPVRKPKMVPVQAPVVDLHQVVAPVRHQVEAVPPGGQTATVFRRDHVKVVVKNQDGAVSMVVRYAGMASSSVTDQVAQLVEQLRQLNYAG